MKQAVPLITQSDISVAYQRFRSALLVDAMPEDGGHRSKSKEFWFSVDEARPDAYVFNLYDARSSSKNLELCFARATPSRQKGGLFTRMLGGTYVCHSGAMWQGADQFVEWYRERYGEGRFVTVAWPDGRGSKQYIVIGRLGSPDLEQRVAAYVTARHRFTSGAGAGRGTASVRKATPLALVRTVAALMARVCVRCVGGDRE